MFLDPTKLSEASPHDVLEAAANGRIGLDHRFLRALLDRPEEARAAALELAARDRERDPVDLTADLIALFRYWKAPEGVPFLMETIREAPADLPDEVVEAVVEIGRPSLEPLLALHADLEEPENGEVAFILASLRLHDPRVLQILEERLQYDLSDGAFLLSLSGDPAAIPILQRGASELTAAEVDLKKEVAEAIQILRENPAEDVSEPFDIWSFYPDEADLPTDLLDEDERTDLLSHPVASVRAAAAASFFNREISPALREKLLKMAQQDEAAGVRARAWEALTDATEQTEVVEAMLRAMKKADLPVLERGGLMVGLAPEADRNEVRKAITELYGVPEGRAKAMEAMWRSVHPSFRDYFAKHLDDNDLEVRRSAVWGIGYYGLKSELDRVRKLFEDVDLRSDALFAYALAMPAELSRGRMKGVLSRIEKDARGLSEIEEELVKAALDERLLLAGKEPFFIQQRD